jgi:hypothetical protein
LFRIFTSSELPSETKRMNLSCKQQNKEKCERRRVPFVRVIFILLLGCVGLVGLFNVFYFVFVQNVLNLYDLWSDEVFFTSSSRQQEESVSRHEAVVEREGDVLVAMPETAAVFTVDFLDESENKTACDLINSRTWLMGPRFGNLNDTLPDDAVHAMLFLFNRSSLLSSLNEQLPLLLGQSICFPESSFRNVSSSLSQSPLDDNNTVLRLWAIRLVYLSFHFHQHRWAFLEAERRWGAVNDSTSKTKCPSQSDLTADYGVGKFDYECPGAKYLLMALGGNGLGANVRGGMVPAMMLGLMTNRVVLFMNNIQATNATQYMQSPWPLASCPRKDYQCFFWPISPCVLTEDDVDNAYQLSFPESRKLVKRSEIPEHAQHFKVWVWSTTSQPISGFHQESADILYTYAQTLVSNVQSESESTEYLDLLNRAVELVRSEDVLRDGYHYAAASYKIQHAAAIYTMRPHPVMSQKLHDIVSEIMPPDLNPDHAVGLPVRGKRFLPSVEVPVQVFVDTHLFTFNLFISPASDKCKGESECLTFEEHMTVVGDMWERHLNDTFDENITDITIVFTTEATSVVKEQQVFAAEQRRVARYPHLKFSFLTNEHDVTPNSGFMKDIGEFI